MARGIIAGQCDKSPGGENLASSAVQQITARHPCPLPYSDVRGEKFRNRDKFSEMRGSAVRMRWHAMGAVSAWLAQSVTHGRSGGLPWSGDGRERGAVAVDARTFLWLGWALRLDEQRSYRTCRLEIEQ